MTSLEGKKAPAFSLAGSDGQTHALKDYLGKTVVLYFYPKDDTPGCTKEACGFRDRQAVLARQDIVVLGLSPDTVASHQKFIEKHQLNFVLLADPDKKVVEKYGAWGEKKNYGKTYMGLIRSTVVIGPDGKVLKHWEKVPNAEKHVGVVQEFLDSRE